MYWARAMALLVVMAGCGAGEENGEPSPQRPVAAPPDTEAPPQPSPAAEAPPQTPPPEAEAPLPADAAWRDCGRIRSPVDGRPQRVEARTFDCRAGRRVAVRYLRNGSLPEGWGPADCSVSRAACEQGGWGFRLVEAD